MRSGPPPKTKMRAMPASVTERTPSPTRGGSIPVALVGTAAGCPLAIVGIIRQEGRADVAVLLRLDNPIDRFLGRGNHEVGVAALLSFTRPRHMIPSSLLASSWSNRSEALSRVCSVTPRRPERC